MWIERDQPNKKMLGRKQVMKTQEDANTTRRGPDGSPAQVPIRATCSAEQGEPGRESGLSLAYVHR